MNRERILWNLWRELERKVKNYFLSISLSIQKNSLKLSLLKFSPNDLLPFYDQTILISSDYVADGKASKQILYYSARNFFSIHPSARAPRSLRRERKIFAKQKKKKDWKIFKLSAPTIYEMYNITEIISFGEQSEQTQNNTKKASSRDIAELGMNERGERKSFYDAVIEALKKGNNKKIPHFR